MLAISPVHRRLAELELINRKRRWTVSELLEIQHCLRVNADIVQRLDGLKELSFLAYQVNDVEWQMELCKKIDDLEMLLR